MKISKLTNHLMLVSLLSISVEVIAADSEYPATDFQPKVVYQDEDYKHTGSSESTSSSSSSSSNKKSKGETSSADPAYPAANFQPEVLYQDDDYKHTKDSASSSSRKSSSSAKTTSSEVGSGEESTSSDDSSMNLIIGLALLAAAGFAFYSKNLKKSSGAKKPKRVVRTKRKATSSEAKTVVATSSESGVAKYLEGKNGAEPSGVAKYLDERNTAVSTVSKYVAKQKITARVASVTGVEKYLKDKS